MSIKEIEKAFNKFAPLRKAKTHWDNVGVLINTGSNENNVLLTIDLTEAVLEECISKKIKNIVAYHPIIFKPIKKLSNENNVIVRCIKNEINVFSPHTSLDPLMNKYIYNCFNDSNFSIKEGSGQNSKSIEEILNFLKKKSKIDHFRLSLGKGHDFNTVPSKMYVGVGSAFRDVKFKDSIIITGEMVHHSLLLCADNSTTVILMEHSNSERICLEYILDLLKKELPSYTISISECDKDPVSIV